MLTAGAPVAESSGDTKASGGFTFRQSEDSGESGGINVTAGATKLDALCPCPSKARHQPFPDAFPFELR